MSEHLKILLSGMVAGDPHQGGASWAILQYVAGLRALGHEVVLVEPVEAGKLDPGGQVGRYFDALPLLDGAAALLARERRETLGLPYAALERFAAEADLLINVSGMLRDERLLESIPVRLFLDLDPGFNQVWQETGEEMGIALHTHCATVGGGVGRKGCPIPTCGRTWIHTLPPIALEHWPADDAAPRRDAFTSVGHWRSYGSIEHGEITYGQRAHSMRQLLALPTQASASFQLALGIHPDERGDLEALRANGWDLLDPREVAGGPERYAEFVRNSKAELSIAKSGYVASRSGWFSDRSACYLASGRPVVAQETGFTTLADAVNAVADVKGDPTQHGRAARAIAEEYLDARRVLGRLLDLLGSSKT
jgi:hypothetical protein